MVITTTQKLFDINTIQEGRAPISWDCFVQLALFMSFCGLEKNISPSFISLFHRSGYLLLPVKVVSKWILQKVQCGIKLVAPSVSFLLKTILLQSTCISGPNT